MPDAIGHHDLPPEVQTRLDQLHHECDQGRWDQVVTGLSEMVDANPAYLAGAAALVRRVLTSATGTVRGELHGVLGRAVELEGSAAEAAALYLAAYEGTTQLRWLEAHCRLAGVDYLIGDPEVVAPWPITGAQRCWMYQAVIHGLAEAAPDAAPDQWLQGCDDTARVTAAWATGAGVDRARLYQAIASRGGFCDCEVLLNTTVHDGAGRGLALVVGSVQGAIADSFAPFEDLLRDQPPPADPTLDPDAEDSDDYLGLYVDVARGRIPLQVTDLASIGVLVGCIVDPPWSARLCLTIGFVGEPPTLITVEPDGDGVRFVDVEDAPPAGAQQAWPSLAVDLAALRARLRPFDIDGPPAE